MGHYQIFDLVAVTSNGNSPRPHPYRYSNGKLASYKETTIKPFEPSLGFGIYVGAK